MTRCVLVREPIQTHAVVEKLTQPEDGATIAFEGIVRNNTRGRRTRFSTTRPTKKWR